MVSLQFSIEGIKVTPKKNFNNNSLCEDTLQNDTLINSNTVLNEQTILAQVETTIESSKEGSTHPPTQKRFKFIRPLGQGGAATVFLAWDNQLERHVAIKLLSQSQQSDNLLFEARIQAQIDHPNICKIYHVEEANQSNTNSYIVMQYIEGKSAAQWIKLQDVSHLQIITMMQKVCDGLKTMHSQGIIHRDIKPDNIMLSSKLTHNAEPYMVDFGLAKPPIADHKNLKQNVSEGTPSYMSPEQWQNAKLDLRADVYSFGATLYVLLTGLKPYPSHINPPPLEQFNNHKWQSVPIELQAIIKKCMSFEREVRYQSANELNQELQNYLTGEPLTCITNKSYRLKKKLIKHKWPAILALTGFISLSTFTGWQHYQNAQQQQRESLIATFSSRVENLEANVKLSKMTTLHNIVEQKSGWLKQIEQLQTDIDSLGEIAIGPGNYAIGRMYFSLQQFDKAIAHLQLARDAGFDHQRVAYPLALSHGAIYQMRKNIIDNIRSRTTRAEKLAALDKRHKTPAIELLTTALKNSPYEAFTKAQILFFQEQYEQALTTLTQAKAQLPSWFYQQHALRGDIYFAKAQIAGRAHQSEQVDDYAKQALTHYSQAALIARSDLQIQLKPVAVYIRLLNNSIYGKQLNFKKLYQSAMETIDNAAIITPDDYQIPALKGRLFSLLRKYQNQHSGDVLTTSEQEIEQYKQALTHRPNDPNLLMSLGMAYAARIKLLKEQSLPVEQTFNLALNTFNQIAKEHQDTNYYNRLGLLTYQLANHHAQKAISKTFNQPLIADNPIITDSFKKAITAYQQVIDTRPNAIAGYANLGLVYRDWSKYVDLPTAKQKIELSIAQYLIAKAFNPNHFVINFNLAQGYRNLIEIQSSMAQDISESHQAALKYLEVAKQSQANHPFVILEAVNLDMIQGINQWEKGQDFQSWFNKAKDAINEAVTKHASNTALINGRNWVYRIEQQIEYLSNGFRIKNQQNYQQALTLTKTADSSALYEHMLIAMLTNQHQTFSEPDFEKLTLNHKSRLAYAIWLSQQNRFFDAEQVFAGIRRGNQSIRLLHQIIHFKHKQTSKNIDTKLDGLNSQAESIAIEKLTQQLSLNFPNLCF